MTERNPTEKRREAELGPGVLPGANAPNPLGGTESPNPGGRRASNDPPDPPQVPLELPRGVRNDLPADRGAEAGRTAPDAAAASLRERLLGGRGELPSRNNSGEDAADPAGRGTPGHADLILRGPREREQKPENDTADRERLPTPLREGRGDGPREPLVPDDRGPIDRGPRGDRGPHGDQAMGEDRQPPTEAAPGNDHPPRADHLPRADRPPDADRTRDADRTPGADRIPEADRNLGGNRELRFDHQLRGNRGPGAHGPGGDLGRIGPKGEHERLGPNLEPGRGGPRGEPGRAGWEHRPARPPSKFAQRLESGELQKVVRGETAAKLRLEEQYRLAAHGGDYARRLELYKNVDRITQINKTTNITNITNVTNINNTHVNVHVGGRPYYYGRVAPYYHRDCFEWNYWGHSFFAGACWYPRWTPWVRWSWYYSCEPVWDPRPLWCRPIVYVPAPVWVYYPVPVWQPLPECESGTWVDVAKVEVGPRPDVQLLAVRLVDPGHPDEKLGPRYRIWIRNNGETDIDRPFNVVAITSLDGRPAAGLPQAGVRVEAVRAGETQSFDIRLPVECYAMGRDAGGKPMPFSTLHVIADADRELAEATRTNNGANIARDKIFPVDPVVFGVDPKEAVEGGEVVLAGEGLGPRPGQVLVNVDGAETEAEILGWFDLGVRVALPKLPAGAGRREVQLIVVRGDGAAANPIGVVVTPAPGAAMGPQPRAVEPREPQAGPVFPQ